MDKVELTIGPDGQEQYGVRKKHNLRGTRYSLPKPKGGKKSVDPVLREDVMMAKMSRRRPKKAAATEDHGWMTEFGGPQQQHGSVALQQVSCGGRAGNICLMPGCTCTAVYGRLQLCSLLSLRHSTACALAAD